MSARNRETQQKIAKLQLVGREGNSTAAGEGAAGEQACSSSARQAGCMYSGFRRPRLMVASTTPATAFLRRLPLRRPRQRQPAQADPSPHAARRTGDQQGGRAALPSDNRSQGVAAANGAEASLRLRRDSKSKI